MEQEFAHSKDKNKNNAINALDAMDIDLEKEIQEIKDNLKQDHSKDGKSIDMSELKDAITVDTQNVERNTDTIFGHVQDKSLMTSG